MNSLYPFISPVVNDVESNNESLPIFYEVGWDFEREMPLIENGDFKIVKENEALKVWIWHCLKVNRFEHSIYSWDFGNEIKSLFGKGYTIELTKCELERYIKEALGLIRDNEPSVLNPYILSCNVLETSFDRDKLSAKIEVETIYEGGVTLNV
ncbi:DUF2634 domain-containing protein [Romboutsia sp. 1001285H_161024_C4]|uniref:DUF2634 domain-containing protein n=1 Tax=Romboutsia sp. 1001285H_161024_C4 TaxID=2787109 RepID=UPI001898D10C|nr:DUF2634 domain-containing protein [Romboutsia sp. 1001285H_161024_C4]